MTEPIVELLRGNRAHAASVGAEFDQLQESQHPEAVTVCCSDSRVMQDHVWGNDRPGRLFTCGNIGNRVVQRTASGEVVSGDVLYPIEHTGTDVAIVVGHTGCGAVTATYDALTNGVSEPPGIEHCLSVLEPHLRPGIEELPADLGRETAVNHLVEYNVDSQVQSVVESEAVPDAVAVYGVVYDFQDVYDGRRGEVHVINVDGVRESERLRSTYPAIADRINRRFTYRSSVGRAPRRAAA